MSRLEERETMALSSLRDISDYSNYIDQRISKLNNLYQSLTINPTPTPNPNPNPSLSHSHKKQIQKPFLSLTRTPPQQVLGKLVHIAREIRERQPSTPPQMYRTEYLPRRQRYNEQSDDKSQTQSNMKSLTISNFRNSLDLSRRRSKQDDKKGNKKLQFYKQIKEDMLGSFYVGGRTFSHHQRSPARLRLTIEPDLPRGRRGKLWHGRPPVKIIEQFD